jgi:hypothetical protein
MTKEELTLEELTPKFMFGVRGNAPKQSKNIIMGL